MIFIDMDGVLTRFVEGTQKVHSISDWELNQSFEAGVYDIAEAYGLSQTEFWSEIDRMGEAFWEGLEPYHNNLLLPQLLDEKGLEYMILTSPPLASHAAAGKIDWMKKWLGPSFRQYALCPKKHLLARKGATLIDDSEYNCEMWEKYGGQAVLVPRPWNKLREYEGTKRKIVEGVTWPL